MNEDLFKGHAGLSEALANAVKAQSDAKKALARAARAQAQGAPGAAPARRCPLGGSHPHPLRWQVGFRALLGPTWTGSLQW